MRGRRQDRNGKEYRLSDERSALRVGAQSTCGAGAGGWGGSTAILRRPCPRLVLQVGGYAHAKQFKRMRKALKRLKGDTGRVMRDLRRHLQDIP